MIITYLPSVVDFSNWKEIEEGYLKRKSLKYPKCIEINITKSNNYRDQYKNEIDIFTIERFLKDIKKAEVEWLVLGNNSEIFLHKSIKKFFEILKDFDLNVCSLKTNGIYLNRVDFENIFSVVKKNIFLKKKESMKAFEKEIFKENLTKLVSYKIQNKMSKPEVFLFEEDFDNNEIKELKKMGFSFLKNLFFCFKEIVPFLPFFFLSIESNGFCYLKNEKNPVSTIFFNPLRKIWNSKEVKRIIKNSKKEKIFFWKISF